METVEYPAIPARRPPANIAGAADPEHGRPSRAGGHETADGYARVLAASGRWRVVRCRDDLQFVVQKRAGRARARPWEALAYILDRKALGPALHRAALGIPAEHRAVLAAILEGAA